MLTPADIQAMADLIAARFQPEKIILFGSYATGTATADSDVDLVVVLDTTDDLLDKTADIRMAVRQFRVPKDILVRTPQMFDQERVVDWTVFSEAERHGRLLYARAS
jgi:predicted nucleotidyltransferase